MSQPLLCALTASVCLAGLSPQGQADDWIETRSKHFTVYSNAGKGRASQTLDDREDLRRLITEMLPSQPIESDIPVSVVLFDSEKSMRRGWSARSKDAHPYFDRSFRREARRDGCAPKAAPPETVSAPRDSQRAREGVPSRGAWASARRTLSELVGSGSRPSRHEWARPDDSATTRRRPSVCRFGARCSRPLWSCGEIRHGLHPGAVRRRLGEAEHSVLVSTLAGGYRAPEHRRQHRLEGRQIAHDSALDERFRMRHEAPVHQDVHDFPVRGVPSKEQDPAREVHD